MPTAKLKKFLDEKKVRYVTIDHSPAFTAQEVAASAHIPGQDMAKTVMVNIDGEMAMAVLPASFHIDLQRLRDSLGARTVELADEMDFADRFPECELGAMPPFGNLYGMKVYVAEALTKDEKISFNAGTHSQLIQMAYADFERLAKPQKVDFTMRSTV
ncbi:MAG: YbaK/EbsC family protein [Candidatus Latescibacterota bacterium]|nr:MAG: YbaK/EbsC family protein [Candidatus Latescibacterota bacterium]